MRELCLAMRHATHVGTSVAACVATQPSCTLRFRYYTMPFCKPPEGVRSIGNTANPGTLLEGLRIENSVYNFTMKVSIWAGQGMCVLASAKSGMPAA